MSDRGLPIVDGAPACPFVAFDDDRDTRATSPDHRHRCYAEVRPAPRALAHQEAYCLSSAFPVCPTFQDWARREAAQARSAASAAEATEAAAAQSPGSTSPDGESTGSATTRGALATTGASATTGGPHRNPHRDWAAPPPWLGAAQDAGADEGDAEVEAQPPPRGGGLSGSLADRLASGSGRPGPTHPPVRWDDDVDAGEDGDDLDAGEARLRPAQSRDRRPGRDDRRPVPGAIPGPSWERPRRMEAFPTLKGRVGLPSLTLPPILVAVAAVVIAAVALFFLPALLGIGNPPGSGVTATPTPTASVAASSGTPAPPTPTPGPTLQIYVVQAGDTMYSIAQRFGVPPQVLIDANAETIPDPDVLDVGQEVIIPSVAPTSLPDAGPSASPLARAAPAPPCRRRALSAGRG